MKLPRRIFFGIFIIIALALGLSAFTWWRAQNRSTQFGVTYSAPYAEHQGLDSKQAYGSILTDLKVKLVRLPVYWNRLETSEGNYDFDELDWQMDEAAKQGAKVTLAIGLKVPRYPECHEPDWVLAETANDRDSALLLMISKVVERYRHHDALYRWQVENEPFFPFGKCPLPSATRYQDELRLVKRLDGDHDIVAATSGEQSIWAMNTFPNDIIGASAYRVVANPKLGPIVFPYGANWYAWQGKLAGFWAKRVILSEVQAEPWGNSSFSETDFRRSVDLARDTGLPEAYLWGVEWWYDLHVEGDDRLWNYAQEIF